MSLPTAALLAEITSHAQSLGIFDSVNGHEPRNASASGVSCAVTVTNIDPIKTSGLNNTSARITFRVQLLVSMLTQPYDTIDQIICNATDALMTDYVGGFTLESNARNVDVRGAQGTPLSARSGYVTIDGKAFRHMDITLPVLCNDIWVEAP